MLGYILKASLNFSFRNFRTRQNKTKVLTATVLMHRKTLARFMGNWQEMAAHFFLEHPLVVAFTCDATRHVGGYT